MPAETHVERGPLGPDEVLALDPRAARRDPRDRRERASRARRASPTTSRPTRSRSSSSSKRSRKSSASAPWASASTTRTSPSSRPSARPSTTSSRACGASRRHDAATTAVARLEAALGARVRASTLTSSRRSSIGPSAPSTRRSSRTSGWSSSATPCSGSSVTDHVFDDVPGAARGRAGEAPGVGRERRGARRSRRSRSSSGPRSSSARARTRRVAATKPSILADAMEAVIAAVYLDGGWDAADDARAAAPRRSHPGGCGGPGWRRLQDAAPGARGAPLRPAAALPGARRGPRPLEAFFATVLHRGRGAWRRRGSIEEAGRAGRRARGVAASSGATTCRSTSSAGDAATGARGSRGTRCLSSPKSRSCAATSSATSSGERVKAVEVDGMRSVRRHHNRKQFISRLEGKKITGVERRGQVHPVPARGRRRARDPPRDVGTAAARQDVARDASPSTRTSSSRSQQGGQLRFVDPRTFGEMFVTEPTPSRRSSELVAPRSRPARRRRCRGSSSGRSSRRSTPSSSRC